MSNDVVEQKVMHVLSLCDQNRDGFVDRSDFETWIARMAAIRGWEPGTEEYLGLEALFLDSHEALQAACGDEEGLIDIQSACGMFVSMAEAGAPELGQWADGFFRLIDADGDGVIGPREYRQLMATAFVDADVADESFARLDVDGDGRISQEEFRQLYLEYYTSDDLDSPGSWFWGRVGSPART